MKITLILWMVMLTMGITAFAEGSDGVYRGKYCEGRGDLEYLELIDRSFSFFHPSPQNPNISMLYKGEWNALIEGSMWGAWWIQNSYGPSFCLMPFLQDPWRTALQNSQDFWFKLQGDGKTIKDTKNDSRPAGSPEMIPPEGCLMDCASPGGAHHKQGDCRWAIHDWPYEFTAAGIILQGELLLVDRDVEAVKEYLPKLDKACDFIESARDPKTGLFLVGPAANLLAPSYGGVLQKDGSFGKGYLSGMSITYIAALDRMIELHKLAGNRKKVEYYESKREDTRKTLPQFETPEGYFVKFIEPDGTKHGVFKQDKFGYFEASPNIDAICHRVVDQTQAEKIYWRIASIPELRPHDFLITNYPSLDDLYDGWGNPKLDGLWEYGRWVNGGVWATLEARVIMAYYRLGKYEDVRRSMLQQLTFTDDYQMDAPLTDFGSQVWFKDKLTNLCYDTLGVPGAVVRGLFEYVYKADSLTLYPHVPSIIYEYRQKEPVRFGGKRLYISIKNGGGRIESVKVNGKDWQVNSTDSVTLPYEKLPKEATVEIVTAGYAPRNEEKAAGTVTVGLEQSVSKKAELPDSLEKPFAQLSQMKEKLGSIQNADYEKAFIAEALDIFESYRIRAGRDAAGEYASFTPEKRAAVLKMYEDAALAAYTGFDGLMKEYAKDKRPEKLEIAKMYGIE